MRAPPLRPPCILAALILAGCAGGGGPPPDLDRAAVRALGEREGVQLEEAGEALSLSRDGEVFLQAWYPEGGAEPRLAMLREGGSWVIWRSPPGPDGPYAVATLGPDRTVEHLDPPDLEARLAAYDTPDADRFAEAALWLGPAAAGLLDTPRAEHASILAALCTGQLDGLAARHDPGAGCVSAAEGLTLCAAGNQITAVDQGGLAGVIHPRSSPALAALAPGEDPLVAAALSACERPDTEALLAAAAGGLGRGDLRVAGLLRRHGAAPALLAALDALPEPQARLGRLLVGDPSDPQAAAAALADPAMAEVLRLSRCRNGRLSLGDLVLLSGREPMGRDALIAALDGPPTARAVAASLLSDLSRRPPGQAEAEALARVLAAELGPIDPRAEHLALLSACRSEAEPLRQAWRLRGGILRRLAGAAVDRSPIREIIAEAREADPVIAEAALYALGGEGLGEGVRRAAAGAVCLGADGHPRADEALSFLYTALRLAESEAAAKRWVDAAAERPCEPGG